MGDLKLRDDLAILIELVKPRGERGLHMNAKKGFTLVWLFALIMTGCAPPKATFEISGSPDPLFYGSDCPLTVIDFTVKGPGEGLKINSIIVGYNLFDGSGKKVKGGTLSLSPYPGRPPIWYNDYITISVPGSEGSSAAPDEPILYFGEGYIEFAATIFAKILSPSIAGPEETYYFTSTKRIAVLPCLPVTIETIEQGPGDEVIIITRESPTATPVPEPTKKPKEDSGGGPPAPPACSVEPNNPNCVP